MAQSQALASSPPAEGMETIESANLSSPISHSSPQQSIGSPTPLLPQTTTFARPSTPPSTDAPLSANSTKSSPTANHSLPKAHNAGPATELTFFRRYFTRLKEDPEKPGAGTRRFSFRSIGFIFSAVTMLVILIIAAAVAGALSAKHHRKTPLQIGGPINPQNPLDPTSPTSPNNTNSESPVRAAIVENFPDPTILLVNGTWYAYATNNGAGVLQNIQPNATHPDPNGGAHQSEAGQQVYANVQVATSTDYVTWQLRNASGDPLPTVGEWARKGTDAKTVAGLGKSNVWAPAIIQRDTDHKYVLYYSALAKNQTLPDEMKFEHHPPAHCVGAAVSESDSPLGPFIPADASLACPTSEGGAIDPAVIKEADGTIWTLWKVDGNNIGHGGECGNTFKPIRSTPIMLQRMKKDGVNADGEPITIMTNTDEDGPLVEAPMLVRSPESDPMYFLFFSSGCTRARDYDVKYATSKTITGPYVRAKKPLLQTGDFGLTAPGSVGVHSDNKGGLNMAFHARVLVDGAGVRSMFTTALKYNGDKVTLERAVKSGSTA